MTGEKFIWVKNPSESRWTNQKTKDCVIYDDEITLDKICNLDDIYYNAEATYFSECLESMFEHKNIQADVSYGVYYNFVINYNLKFDVTSKTPNIAYENLNMKPICDAFKIEGVEVCKHYNAMCSNEDINVAISLGNDIYTNTSITVFTRPSFFKPVYIQVASMKECTVKLTIKCYIFTHIVRKKIQRTRFIHDGILYANGETFFIDKNDPNIVYDAAWYLNPVKKHIPQVIDLDDIDDNDFIDE